MLEMLVVNKSKERGMTLLEIVIAMSILGILAALGMPNLFSMLDKNNLDQSLDKLQTAIQHAQRQALRLDQSCGIYIVQQSGVYKLVGLNSRDLLSSTTTTWERSRNCLQAEAVTITFSRATAKVNGFTLPEGVQVRTNETRSFIEFNSNGFPNFASGTGTTDGALIVLKATGVTEQKCFFVSPTTGTTRNGKYIGDFNGTLSISQCKINSLY